MATIKVVRFSNKQGKRKYDRAAVVLWDISYDDVNRRLIIQTEETRYYAMVDWLFSPLTVGGKEDPNAEIEVLKRKSCGRSFGRAKKTA